MKVMEKNKTSSAHGVYDDHDQGLKRSFKTIMRETTEEMPLRQRVFSLFIHSKPIWVASDFAGKVLLRPDAILLGAIFSFVVTMGVYLLSKNYGYGLSGLESIVAFLVGWIAGIAFDCFTALLKRGR